MLQCTKKTIEKPLKFNFENLEVWKKAVDFSVSVIDLLENLKSNSNHLRLKEQLEASSTSVAANIAEGKGRQSQKEFIQFLYIARGSLFETITFLTIFHRKKWINKTQLDDINSCGQEISKMISCLINSIRNSMGKK